MTKFFCKNCGYRIETENLQKCPYCNKASLQKEKNAEELLDEINDE